MGIIKTDPSQTKTAVVLIVVLVAAVVVTVVRMRAAAPAKVVEVATRTTTLQSSASFEPSTQCRYPLRNPFEKPVCLRDAAGELVRFADVDSGRTSVRVVPLNPWASVSRSKVEPISAPEVGKPECPLPTFTLLATVKSEKGYSAVIRNGDSDVRVVEVGDRLWNGFIVKCVEPDRAVLTDGRNVIIASRPQS